MKITRQNVNGQAETDSGMTVSYHKSNEQVQTSVAISITVVEDAEGKKTVNVNPPQAKSLVDTSKLEAELSKVNAELKKM